MDPRLSMILRMFAGILMISQTLICALKETPNVDEFNAEIERSRIRDNYDVRKLMDGEISGNDHDFGVKYSTDYFDMESNPEELPSMLMDYANMIRNDIVLLDNSVDQRPQKRGNFKIKKNNQGVGTNGPCNCALENIHNELIYLGDDFFPRYVKSKTCSHRLCPSTHNCQRNFFNVSILKKANTPNEISEVEVPRELRNRWIGIKLPIIIGCTCVSNFIDRT